jgi:hypothetical protein
MQRYTSALDLFIDGMIGRGVVIVPAMRKALPEYDTRTNGQCGLQQ